MNVAFVTFGCRLNRAESLDLEAEYVASGWNVVDVSPSASPDRIVVRGCSVTARAQRDCEKAIDRLRLRFPAAELVVTGCLPSASPSVPVLAASSSVPLSTSRAYLKVQDGCSNRCAFCIVPRFRGAPVSIPLDRILARAVAFLNAGFRELVVTGCNLCLYRSDGVGLPGLVARLADLPFPERFRIRLGSIEPGICDRPLVETMAAHPNVCRFLHLSLQSGSDRILKAMRRPYSIDTVSRLCDSVSGLLGNDTALGADVITGFPGETDADFTATRSFLTPRPSSPIFSNLHVFPYSERPGTEAAVMPNPVERSVRIARARILENLGTENRRAFASRFIGRMVEVCVEKDGTGLTPEYLRLDLKTTKGGKFAALRRTLVCVPYALPPKK